MKQYIDFFNSQREAIENNSAPVMNALRSDALHVVETSDLPKLGDENYEILGIDTLFAPDYGINANRIAIPADVHNAFKCGVPNMSTWIYFLINDTFTCGNTSGKSLPDGVIVSSLREATIQHPDLVSKYYGKIAPIADPQVALNTLLAQDGAFIYIPDGVVLEKPLQFVNILNGGVPMMANRRILIVLGENAQAKLLSCDHTQNREVEFLNNQVIEIYAGKNSMFDIYDMEESSEKTKRVSSLWAKQESSSNLLVNGITLVNGTTRNNISIQVDGENAETHMLGMAICSDHQIADNHTLISHNVPRCHSKELFKYLLEDDSKGSFTGKILVKPGADKTEAYQGNKNIVASDRAKMHTKPQLEIYTDDVKCSHGATIGQLDQNAMFYMRTRGISEAEARMLLMQAFMNEVISSVRIETLRDRLHHLVERRLSGSIELCNDCSSNCGDIIRQ